jgi:hypothetical protein
MKTTTLGLLIFLIGVMSACERSGSPENQASIANLPDRAELYKKATMTKALSKLKKYQVASSLNLVEFGRYESLHNLYERSGYAGIIDEEFYKAWDGHDQPTLMDGYLFSNIDENINGETIDHSLRAGLSAYPSQPEKGDNIFCILADLENLNPEIVEGGYGAVSHGEEWTVYRVIAGDIVAPIRTWPSDAELADKFHALKKRTPGEALKEAQRMVDRIKQ